MANRIATLRDWKSPVLDSQSRNSLIINCISCYDSHVLTDRNRCNPQIHGCDSNSITLSAVFAPVALQDAKVIRVENKHQPYSSFRISVCRSSRPNRRISAKSGSSLNEPSILAIHPGFFAERSILLDCESLRRVTSFSNCSSRSSTVAIYISQESNKTPRSTVPCSSSRGKGRKDAI
jgi:hypothetical protein